MKKLFLAIIAIELALLLGCVESIGSSQAEQLERIASELEYLSDR